jgi:hypothetical protein
MTAEATCRSPIAPNVVEARCGDLVDRLVDERLKYAFADQGGRQVGPVDGDPHELKPKGDSEKIEA